MLLAYFAYQFPSLFVCYVAQKCLEYLQGGVILAPAKLTLLSGIPSLVEQHTFAAAVRSSIKIHKVWKVCLRLGFIMAFIFLLRLLSRQFRLNQ